MALFQPRMQFMNSQSTAYTSNTAHLVQLCNDVSVDCAKTLLRLP